MPLYFTFLNRMSIKFPEEKEISLCLVKKNHLRLKGNSEVTFPYYSYIKVELERLLTWFNFYRQFTPILSHFAETSNPKTISYFFFEAMYFKLFILVLSFLLHWRFSNIYLDNIIILRNVYFEHVLNLKNFCTEMYRSISVEDNMSRCVGGSIWRDI